MDHYQFYKPGILGHDIRAVMITCDAKCNMLYDKDGRGAGSGVPHYRGAGKVDKWLR